MFMSHKDKQHLYQKIITLCLLALMIFLTFVDIPFVSNEDDQGIIRDILVRFIGGVIALYWMIIFGYKSLFRFKQFKKSIIIMIPALIISFNNFPIIAYLDDRAVLTEPTYRVILFMLVCLSVGFFEEIIFRGVILTFLLKSFANHEMKLLYSIVISSVIFALSHLFNLFEGASYGDTFLQIGYSFLVGMLWAVMFLKTKNIWLTMLLHASFNFFGQVMFRLGDVDHRYDSYTIGITVGLSVLVAVYAYWIYKKILHEDLLNFNS